MTLRKGRLSWVVLLMSVFGLNACADLGQTLTGGRPFFARVDTDKTPLHRAVRDHQTSQVAQLLAAGADPNVHDNRGVTPLYQAVQNGAADMVALLLAAGADPNVHDIQGFTPLYETTRGEESTESTDIMAQLLAAGADPNAATPWGVPLEEATGFRNLVGMRMLLTAGADPNAHTEGYTSLHLAAMFSFLEGARMLLAAGADPNAHTERGYTPLHAAVGSDAGVIVGAPSQAWMMVEVLLAAGADPNARMNTPVDSGVTPLHKAAQHSDPWVAKVLLAAGADPNARMDSGETPLQIAQHCYAYYSSPGVAQTPFHVAKRHGSAAMMDLLRHHTVSVNDASPGLEHVATGVVDKLEQGECGWPILAK